MSIKYLPWHEKVWGQIADMRERLPHAMLLHGRPGIGKRHLAEVLAQSLLCENRGDEGLACGTCPACVWFASGNHPDFRLIQPEALAPVQEEAEAAENAEDSKKKP